MVIQDTECRNSMKPAEPVRGVIYAHMPCFHWQYSRPGVYAVSYMLARVLTVHTEIFKEN